MKEMKMRNINIRGYTAADAQAVRKVCLATGSDQVSDPAMQKLLLAAFCDYYIEYEPENCFVAADEDNQAIGYILCAENAERWMDIFRARYIATEQNAGMKQFLEGSSATPMKFAHSYPAHLHIDILPSYQRMGLGTKLVDILVAHLRSKGISGLMLSVSNDNEKGIRFYQKYGFDVLEQLPHETAMGISL